jgi:hypothetical protein
MMRGGGAIGIFWIKNVISALLRARPTSHVLDL